MTDGPAQPQPPVPQAPHPGQTTQPPAPPAPPLTSPLPPAAPTKEDIQRQAREAAADLAAQTAEIQDLVGARQVLLDGIFEAHDNHVKELNAMGNQVSKGIPVTIPQILALLAAAQGLLDAIKKLRG